MNFFSTRVCKYAAMTTLLLMLACGQMWGQTSIYASGYENGMGTWNTDGGMTVASETTNYRTGTKAIKGSYTGSSSAKCATQETGTTTTSDKSTYCHIIGWAKSANGTMKAYIGFNSSKKGSEVTLSTSNWTRISYVGNEINATTIILYKKGSGSSDKYDVYYDDIVAYSSSSNTTDLTAPSAASSASATTSSISWTNGSDSGTGATGRQNTLIWRRTSGSSDDLTLNAQGIYAASATDQSGHWTCVSASVAAGTDAATSSYAGTFSAGDRYAIVHRDLAYNYSTPTYVTVAAAANTYKLKGDWDSWTEHTMTVSAGVASYSLSLAADTRYEFCFMENSTAYKNNGAILAPVSNWDFNTSDNNAHIHTGPAGTYTFTMNTSNHKVSVTYPEVTHPNDHYVYFKNASVWGTVYAYLANSGNDNKAAAWPGCPTPTTTICNETYHYAAMNSMSGTYNLIIFNNGGSGSGNQSWNLSTTGSGGKYNANANNTWYSFPVHTLSFNANKGSGSMDDIINICDGTDETAPANEFTRTGWTFVGWCSNKYGTGKKIYQPGDEISDIEADSTFYAQWERTIYFYSTTSNWYDDNAVTQLHCWDNDDNTKNLYITMTRSDDCSDPIVYEATIPGGGYDKLQFKRLKSDQSESWNETVDLNFNSSYNMYKLTNMTGGEGGKAYGVFEADYSAPSQYTITFNAGEGSGSMSVIEDICEGADQALTANSFTAPTGYEFDAWHANVDVTVSSSTVSKGDDIDDEATLEDLASDVTLTAQWKAKTYTVTLDDEDATTSVSPGSVTATYNSSTIASITNPLKTGYTFGGWYKSEAGAGGLIISDAGALQNSTDYTDGSGNWTNDDDATVYAKWTQSVTIDDNGGSADGSVTVTYNGTAGTPSVPTYAGHTVDLGYYAESSCTNKVMALDGTLQASVTDGSSDDWTNSSSKWVYAGAATLYAHWKCNTPTISCTSNVVTITVPSGTTVRYTTDGTTPTSSTGTVYSSAFSIAADVTVKAIAYQSGCTDSEVASEDCEYVVSGTNYYLFTPTSAPNPVHTGTLSGDFITDKSVGDGTAQTIDGNEFSKKSITIAGSTLSGSISGKKAGNYSIDYDVKTTSTTFYVYVSGANTSIYMHKIRESGYTTDSIVSQSTGASTGVKLTFTLKSKENTRVCFSTGSTSVRCYQIVAVESGDALPQACDEGYELNFNSGRYAYLAGSSNQRTGSIDGLDICSYNSYQYKNSTALELTKNSSDTYISFTTGASACAVKVTFSAGTLILNTSKSTSGGVSLTSNTAANLAASTTYYIVNTHASDRAYITKIAFEEADASTYTVTYDGNDETSGDAPVDGDSPYAAGSNVTVLGNTGSLAKTNYTFDGWNTANDGSGTSYAAGATISSIAANVDLYAKWKQTVTLTTGAQGSGSDQTPYVYKNGTGVSSFTPHTADGYTLQGYYTAGSGGTKVLNDDGTFAAANVTDYITSSKWSRTGAAPTLYAQWVASEDCHTLKYAWKASGKYCDDETTSVEDTVRFPANASNLYFTVSGTGNTVSKGSSYNIGKTQNNYFLLTAKSGYEIKSICFYGKIEDSSVNYTTDGSSWSSLASAGTSSDKYYSFDDIDASAFGIKLTESSPKGVWIRNMVIEICAAGGTTYNVTYDDNGSTGGTAPTDNTDYDYGETVTIEDNGTLAKTNYTFAGWTTNDDGTGSSYVADNTFSITDNTTLYAKWTQGITFDANTANHGSTGGSATAVWNAKGLTSITHAKPASGYKLSGYYTAATSGTKVLNSDGTFASTAVTDYITSGKWSRTGAAPTLYAQYESAGALTWNLIVNSDTTALSTSTKSSAFTEISTTNMTNAAITGLTYTKSSKSSLTGKISTETSYDAAKYVAVTFQVASGYKFIPSSVKVIAQPVSTRKNVKLALSDASSSLVMASDSVIDGGKKKTVILAGDGSTAFEGTVTLKIYCYGATDAYRLGTPITIEGEVEEACNTRPSYTSMSYSTTDYTVGDTPGAISIVGGENIDTYLWKSNMTNDRSGGSPAGGTNDESSYTPSAASAGTTYYWCEMTNTDCGITIKSPAVAINVSASKSTATVTWDSKAKYNDRDTTAYYGGKNYTLKATLNSGWDGTLTADMFTAPTGIRLHDFTIDNSSNPKTIKATFDVQTTFDIDENDSIDFTLSLPATTNYNALSSDKKVAYNNCSGAGEGSSYNIRMRKTVTKDGNYYHCANTDGWISPNISSSYSTAKAGTTMETYFDTVASSNTQYVWVRTYHANVNKVRIYADFREDDMTVSNVYKHTAYFSADSKYAVDYTAVYKGDEENEDLGDQGQEYVDIILNEVMAANDILLVKFSAAKVRPLGAVITESSAGSLTTSLAWSNSLSDGATVNKTQSSANFTYTASPTSTNSNTLGAISYSSSNTSCATVNATTGEVTITATGTSDLSTTITATLSASGCYKGKTITYTISVPGVSCTVEHGTLTSDVTSKCSTADATLTLTGFEDGATIQWYNGESTISDGATYAITTEGTTSTMVTKEAGTYSVLVTNSAGTCSDRSNSITITNVSAEASVTKIVDEWYVKNGRLTPDIALWTMSEGATLKSVAWSSSNATGLTCYASDGIIYLQGKSPSSNDSGADIEYTLTATITDECNTDHEETTKTIKITHQKNTDKHVLAFVVEGTAKGGFTAGITAAQTTNVDLYNTIAANFDVLATNIYSTDDEKKLKEYYSQFDILCITDYPNTKTKGVNSKSYVDAMGALVDIRPILTMEAWVSGLANWKAKGISGTPKSPTTRQYTMLLQCKDHEIFSGTKLTKIGEGDTAMYRVSMVCDTLEDYKTLDATYGAGTHESDKNYQYGKKPALQGFTFDATMADDGLLPLGEIDDGSGNELQVGIERQAEMEARLMVLGINGYAMERLTDDGQTVVVNALKYLMKKNSEDIADCSNTFVGGAEGDEKNWNNAANWSGNAIPERTQKVRIVAECEIPADVKPHVTGVIIAPSGKYNHGANTANGSLTIAAGGALIVDGKIEAATAPLYTETRATSPEILKIEASSTAQGALIFDNEDGETQATVEMYSPSYWEVVAGKKKKYWSYVGVPIEDVEIPNYFYLGFTYLYDETSGWIKKGDGSVLHPFEGIGLSMQSGHMETFYGTLASTETREITLTKTTSAGNGENLIGNSWIAPIQIANFDAADFGDATATVYVYNTGRDVTAGGSYGGTGSTTAGQWVTVPVSSAKDGAYDGLKVIPAMNAFQVNTDEETTLTLDYDKLVRKGATSATVEVMTTPLRAPRRQKATTVLEAMMRVRVSGAKTHTDVWLQQDERFTEAFDNGWEAKYAECDNRSAQFYAQSEIGKMAFLALPDMEGTILGFAPSRYGNEYTFTFHYVGEDEFYLNDLKLKKSTLISEDESYSFLYEDGDTNRFYISRIRIDVPQTPTGVENTHSGTVKARKFIYNDKMYILFNGRVYSADGQMVK